MDFGDGETTGNDPLPMEVQYVTPILPAILSRSVPYIEPLLYVAHQPYNFTLLQVVSVNIEEDYILANAHLLHSYPTTSTNGQPWQAVFEYCCRGQTIRNNKETR